MNCDRDCSSNEGKHQVRSFAPNDHRVRAFQPFAVAGEHQAPPALLPSQTKLRGSAFSNNSAFLRFREVQNFFKKSP